MGELVLKRIFFVWLTANFIIVGAVSWLAGGWYLGWRPLAGMLAELGLIMFPNLLLSLLVLRYWWPEPVSSIREALGWSWKGWRSIIVGISAFALAFVLSEAISRVIGESIPYELPGNEGAIGPIEDLALLVGLLFLLVGVVSITVAGEETLFRGLIQTQISIKYGPWLGLLVSALLFGLRHLPADIFYARAWHATPQMWVTRQLQLYSFALILGLARRYGRSTYAPAIAHALMFLVNLFG
jgi:membrane protease YdiL (CAAX protease family)